MPARWMLLFAPALGFGIAALASSALALGFGLGSRTREEAVVRNRVATTVAVVAAVLCAFSLLAGAGLLILQALPEGD